MSGTEICALPQKKKTPTKSKSINIQAYLYTTSILGGGITICLLAYIMGFKFKDANGRPSIEEQNLFGIQLQSKILHKVHIISYIMN